MPNANRDPKAEHLEARITPYTVFFDHDKIADLNSPLSHTLPPLSFFEECMMKLQISQSDNIVCYDA